MEEEVKYTPEEIFRSNGITFKPTCMEVVNEEGNNFGINVIAMDIPKYDADESVMSVETVVGCLKFHNCNKETYVFFMDWYLNAKTLKRKEGMFNEG